MSHSIQDQLLQKVQDEQVEVSIYLLSGIKLYGTIQMFDDKTIWLKNVASQLIFKHAVSTIVPSKYIEL